MENVFLQIAQDINAVARPLHEPSLGVILYILHVAHVCAYEGVKQYWVLRPARRSVFVLPRLSSPSSSPRRIFLYIGHHSLRDSVLCSCLGPSRNVASLALVTGLLLVSFSSWSLADCAP